MSDRVREQLLGYLLGALDDSERVEIESRLRDDPEFRKELVLLRRQLESLGAAECDCAPPPGLAERTCARVFSHPSPAPRRRPSMTPQAASAGWTGRVGWFDATVAAAVFLAAGMVVLPAIQGSRFRARLVECRDNLRQLGVSLTAYSRNHHDSFPQVPADGKQAAAGIYAPVLVDGRYLTEPRRVICPDSAMAEVRDFHVPSVAELQAADEEKAAQLRQQMGGSYGYCLGYVERGSVRPTRDSQRQQFALMADAPSQRPGHQTDNHGGLGQNVLFEDGHVSFLTCSQPSDQLDDIFANDNYQVAPGLHRNDSVIAASGTPPVVLTSRDLVPARDE
jgi:hypothetical protein